ncbi:MAG: DUF721 domain-containing protein [Candidatus Rokuibacteriota bacterium]
MRRTPAASRVGDVLPGVLSDLKLSGPLAAQTAVERWREVAGERLSRHVRAVAVENGVLRLEAEAAVWASEVRFQERRILSRLKEACGAEHVREIRCTLGTGAWNE